MINVLIKFTEDKKNKSHNIEIDILDKNMNKFSDSTSQMIVINAMFLNELHDAIERTREKFSKFNSPEEAIEEVEEIRRKFKKLNNK